MFSKHPFCHAGAPAEADRRLARRLQQLPPDNARILRHTAQASTTVVLSTSCSYSRKKARSVLLMSNGPCYYLVLVIIRFFTPQAGPDPHGRRQPGVLPRARDPRQLPQLHRPQLPQATQEPGKKGKLYKVARWIRVRVSKRDERSNQTQVGPKDESTHRGYTK